MPDRECNAILARAHRINANLRKVSSVNEVISRSAPVSSMLRDISEISDIASRFGHEELATAVQGFARIREKQHDVISWQTGALILGSTAVPLQSRSDRPYPESYLTLALVDNTKALDGWAYKVFSRLPFYTCSSYESLLFNHVAMFSGPSNELSIEAPLKMDVDGSTEYFGKATGILHYLARNMGINKAITLHTMIRLSGEAGDQYVSRLGFVNEPVVFNAEQFVRRFGDDSNAIYQMLYKRNIVWNDGTLHLEAFEGKRLYLAEGLERFEQDVYRHLREHMFKSYFPKVPVDRLYED